jgi:hypothetical protein
MRCQDPTRFEAELGIAARYLGLVFAAPEEGGADSVEVQTHAWIEALVADGRPGAALGLDRPTDRGPGGETHVKIGHGATTRTWRRSGASTAGRPTANTPPPSRSAG